MEKMAVAQRMGQAHWLKGCRKKQGMRDGTAERICGQSLRGARNGAARESTAGRRNGAAMRIGDKSSQEACAIGAKRIDKMSQGPIESATDCRDGTAKIIGDKSSRGACAQSGPT